MQRWHKAHKNYDRLCQRGPNTGTRAACGPQTVIV